MSHAFLAFAENGGQSVKPIRRKIIALLGETFRGNRQSNNFFDLIGLMRRCGAKPPVFLNDKIGVSGRCNTWTAQLDAVQPLLLISIMGARHTLLHSYLYFIESPMVAVSQAPTAEPALKTKRETIMPWWTKAVPGFLFGIVMIWVSGKFKPGTLKMEQAFYATGLLSAVICGAIVMVGLLTVWGKYHLNYRQQKKRQVEAALPRQSAQPTAQPISQHDPFRDIRGYDD